MGMKNSDWGERRHPCRWMGQDGDLGFWMPDRSELFTQFFTRYLFSALAVLYFSSMEYMPPLLFSLEYVLFGQVIYFLINSLFFHLSLRKVTLWRIRGAMAADLLNVTLCLIHDPYLIPPAALGYLMVLLGNGMRYGMRLFAEVLGGVFTRFGHLFCRPLPAGRFYDQCGGRFFRCVPGNPGCVCPHPDGPYRGAASSARLP